MSHRSLPFRSAAPGRVTRLVVGLTTALLLGAFAVTGTVVLAGPAAASTGRLWPGHPGRHLVTHVVHRGDTATGLAVRYHAWTAELLSLNHLGPRSVLLIGRRLLIPVVDAAVARSRHPKPSHAAPATHRKPVRHVAPATRDQRLRAHGWRHFTMSREQVRRTVTATARRHGVPASLALAIAWQESGWYQPVVSSAGAIGVMQLLPSTGTWMSQYAGRRLHLKDTYDNVLGGVLLLRVLREQTAHDRQAIAAYYQGLGAVQHHGIYRSSRPYVRSVQAILKHLRATGRPIG